jgi:hypothetical protein
VTAKLDGRELVVATTEATALIAKGDVAAAVLAAALQAIANGFQHVAALGISARAGDRTTAINALTLALAAGQFEIANLNSVAHAAARAVFVADGFTEALQLGAFHRIIAVAGDSEAVCTFLKCELAPHGVLNVHLWRCEGRPAFGCFGEFNHRIAGHNRTPSNEGLSAGLSRGPKVRASEGVARWQRTAAGLFTLFRLCRSNGEKMASG